MIIVSGFFIINIFNTKLSYQVSQLFSGDLLCFMRAVWTKSLLTRCHMSSRATACMRLSCLGGHKELDHSATGDVMKAVHLPSAAFVVVNGLRGRFQNADLKNSVFPKISLNVCSFMNLDADWWIVCTAGTPRQRSLAAQC